MPILIDWGTTFARCYLVDDTGTILDRRENGPGLKQIARGRFQDAFDRMVNGWISPDHAPSWVLMSGMVGSRQGWVEAPYTQPPATIADLAAAVMLVPDRDRYGIVPGVACQVDGHWDVMRGEETQIFGAMARDPSLQGGLFCLPGTHGKWARVENRALIDFRTAMTGELFAVLRRHSLLGAMMKDADAPDWQSFRLGLDRAAQDGGLLHHLFSVRGDALFGTLPETGLADYLSGILIGREILDLGRDGDDPVTVIANPDLGGRYAQALSHLGRPCRVIDAAAATVTGLLAIARSVFESGDVPS